MTSHRFLQSAFLPSRAVLVCGALCITLACSGSEEPASGSGGAASASGGASGGDLSHSTGGATMSSGGSSSGGSARGGSDSGGAAVGAGGGGSGGELGTSTGGSIDASGGSASGGAGAEAGGTASGGTVACAPETPPAEFLETMEITYAEMIGQFDGQTGARPPWFGVLEHDNFIWDQVFATGGQLNYCIRWDSAGTLTASRVVEIEETLEELANIWFQFLEGYNCWPFGHIPVKVVGVAVAERQRASWGDGESVPVYVGDFREDAPQCPEACGRFFHTDGDYSGCA